MVERSYVTLDGSGSSDDVGIVNYTWVFFYGGINRTLHGMVNDSFRFMNPGVYNVTLNVTDVEGNYTTDIVVITVLDKKVSVFVAYWWAFLSGGVAAFFAIFMHLLISGKLEFVSEPTREKYALLMRRLLDISREVMRHKMGFVGVVILIFFFCMAAFGPILAPYEVDATDEGQFESLLKPSKEHWMGTDFLCFIWR